MLPPTARTAHN